MSKTKIISVSGVVIAMYIVIMFVTQHFAFGAYQIRVATALYALSYSFPFLVVPLGLANGLGNFIGGLGMVDVIGGALVGFVTGGGVYVIKRFKWPMLLITPVIILGPGLIVPVWLSPITGVPYPILALSLCIGQTPPAVAGYFLIQLLNKMGVKKWMDSRF